MGREMAAGPPGVLSGGRCLEAMIARLFEFSCSHEADVHNNG